MEHIYINTHYGRGEIKLLCTNEWVKAEKESEITHRNDGCHINGVHQWSIGAGHNSTCPDCLIKFAERKMKTDQVLMRKILNLAKNSTEKAQLDDKCSSEIKEYQFTINIENIVRQVNEHVVKNKDFRGYDTFLTDLIQHLKLLKNCVDENGNIPSDTQKTLEEFFKLYTFD